MAKWIYVAVLALLLAGGAFWLLSGEGEPALDEGEPSQAAESSPESTRGATQQTPQGDGETGEPLAVAGDEADLEADDGPKDGLLQAYIERGCIDDDLSLIQQLSPTNKRELETWLESQGHFGGLDMTMATNIAPFDDYSSYETDALRTLAGQHSDKKAQLALATRLLEQGEVEEMDEALHWLRESIIGGYTIPIMMKSTIKQMQRLRQSFEEEMSREEREALLKEGSQESIAYIYFAEMRGAPIAPALVHMAENNPGMLAPTHDQEAEELDLEAAREHAQTLLDDYQSERSSRGLGAFNNQRPAVANVLDQDVTVLFQAMQEGLMPCNMQDLH